MIDELSKYDRSSVPAFGRLLNLVGGKGVQISRKKMGIMEMNGMVIIYQQKEEDPDNTLKDKEIITDFDE